MPYVSDEIREALELDLQELLTSARDITDDRDKMKGIVNYLATLVTTLLLQPDTGWSYASMSDTIGALECAKLEVYRRLLAPYEDMAVDKNGDLDVYSVYVDSGCSSCCCCEAPKEWNTGLQGI
jgi:hypothetical protein